MSCSIERKNAFFQFAGKLMVCKWMKQREHEAKSKKLFYGDLYCSKLACFSLSDGATTLRHNHTQHNGTQHNKIQHTYTRHNNK